MEANNMAEMREALEKAKHVIHYAVVMGMIRGESVNNAYISIRDALSAPPRNCDRIGSESEMRAAFIDWYNEAYDIKGSNYEIDTSDLKHDVDGILHDYIKWLFAPTDERKGERE